MEILINELYELIKDHREDEGFMTVARVKAWITQFNEDDREFVLIETIHILKKRYLSKEGGRTYVKYMIEYLTEMHKCGSVKEFMADSYFINNQPQGKSQPMLLEFLNEVLKKEYSTSLDECNAKSPKYIIYLDDVLCTGETIVKGLTDQKTGWFNQTNENGRTNYEEYIKNDAHLVFAYLATHTRSSNKLANRLYFTMGKKDIKNVHYVWNTNFVVNNIYDEPNSNLNLLFPIQSDSESIKSCKEQIEKKINDRGYNLNKITFRSLDKPVDEELFSSAENRNRYELIVLEKSIECYNFIPNDNVRARPLGYGLYDDVSFGFGTMIFTWRNVPFNTPLLFWYPHNGWQPLFKREFT
ncbi:hypothetical protein FA048_04060 [Pedobacter polaris]|uniref:PRTase-CE domain-containing protein n=1 Tax=Pedobacter polaris TaxID=2571273 RepID=A0A4U1CU96_9SPHI|nr:hypothetical protein [Pedobacter polaris]TKC12801.1 hypothetical protein FA048_04060 [Pedobacter polaris]